ncbi:MAG: hypothetical protein ACE5F6_07180 [Anaerolineae bacterium]
MKFRSVLILSALVALAAGMAALTSGLPNATVSDVSHLDSASASTMNAAKPSGPPPMPASFYGTVTVNGTDAREGTRVSAWIEGVRYATTETFTFDGRAMYALGVPADDPATPEVDGGQPGDTIVFHVGGLKAAQAAAWQGGANSRLDLTSASARLFLPLVSRVGSQGN